MNMLWREAYLALSMVFSCALTKPHSWLLNPDPLDGIAPKLPAHPAALSIYSIDAPWSILYVPGIVLVLGT